MAEGGRTTATAAPSDRSQHCRVVVSARADYAIRAMVELARQTGDDRVKSEALARTLDIPERFLSNILPDLSRAGLLSSRRGAEGGYRLALAPQEISLGSIVAALPKPAKTSRRGRCQTSPEGGPANQLDIVWMAVHEGFRSILASMALSDVVEGRLFEAWTPTPPV